MRGRKRRLVRHQRIWRATMKCCASTFAYALTGPFSGNASRRDLDAGRGVPVPENDTCGPTTPTQHEQRLAMNLSSRAIAARRKPLLQNRARTAWSHGLIPDGAFQRPQSTLAVVLPTLGACNAAHAICGGPSSRKRTSWPRGSAVSDGDLRTSPSGRVESFGVGLVRPPIHLRHQSIAGRPASRCASSSSERATWLSAAMAYEAAEQGARRGVVPAHGPTGSTLPWLLYWGGACRACAFGGRAGRPCVHSPLDPGRPAVRRSAPHLLLLPRQGGVASRGVPTARTGRACGLSLSSAAVRARSAGVGGKFELRGDGRRLAAAGAPMRIN